jgi:peptidoglycan L-alanyl-D-glutamate endopeptidase CwlK
MSANLSETEILFRQRLLKCCGLYTGKLDSKWGPKTEAADQAFLAEYERLKKKHGARDARTETNILSLHLTAQDLARKFLSEFGGFAFDIRIISGTRTYDQQNALYRQGRRGNAGPIVTNARGGQSNHNFGIAWDIGLFDSGKYLTGANARENAAYESAAVRGLANGLASKLEWGGSWKTFQDQPHYQAVANLATTTEVREAFEAGKPYL